MKEFIDKLIERLKVASENACVRADLDEWYDGKESGLLDAIEIVNQLAEEYKGGWIPCSERLPEKNGTYIVMIEKAEFPTTLFYNAGCWEELIDDETIFYSVIAWQPLPQPYKEGE